MANQRERIDVAVKLTWDTQGKLTPTSIIWKDGQEFVVDRVLNVCNGASLKAGGMGQRFTVRITNEEYKIFGKTTYLFLDQGQEVTTWFVEGKV